MPNFTDEEINAILQEFYAKFADRKYIGARYVPIFGRRGEESIAWDDTKPYEPLTIVLHEGNSYTSRQFVPAGIPITDADFWAQTGNYDAQVQQCLEAVQQLELQVSNNTGAIGDLQTDVSANTQNIANETQARQQADGTIEADILSLELQTQSNYQEIKANDAGVRFQGYSLFQAEYLLPSTTISTLGSNPFRLDMFTSKQIGIRGAANILEDIPASTNLMYFQVPITSTAVQGYWNTGTLVRNGVEQMITFFIRTAALSYKAANDIPMMTLYASQALKAGDVIRCFPYMQSSLGMGTLRPWNNTLFTEAIAARAAYFMSQFSGLTYDNGYYNRTRLVPTYDPATETETVKSTRSDCSGTIWCAYYLALQEAGIPACLSDYASSLASGSNNIKAWNQDEDWTVDELSALVKPGDIISLSERNNPGYFDHVVMVIDSNHICHTTTTDINGADVPAGGNPLTWTFSEWLNRTYLNPRTRMRVLTRFWE